MKKFFPGDKVFYTGNKFHELKSKLGEVAAHVNGSDTSVVVDFGDDSYVMPNGVLRKFKPSKDPNAKEPEVQIRRKRYDEGENEK